MRLYLVQHGAAKSEAEDPQGGLTEEGQRTVERMADFPAALRLPLDRIEHSEKLRARQTAEILAAQAQQVLEKNCEIGVGFSFAALSVFRLRRAEVASAVWIPHWHWEPFESQGARAAKRYVNGNLVEREKGDEFGIETPIAEERRVGGKRK